MWIQYNLVDVRNLDTIEKEYYDVETDVKMHKLIMNQWQELIKHNEYLGVTPKEISVLIRWAISYSLGRRIYIYKNRIQLYKRNRLYRCSTDI